MPSNAQPARRRPHGFGSVVKKVSRGYVVFKPKVVVGGTIHWGEGVGWRRAVESEDEARARAHEKLEALLADLAAAGLVAPEVPRLTVGELCRSWLAMIHGSARAPLTKREYRKRLTAILQPELAARRVADLRPADLDGPDGLYARLRAAGMGSSSLMHGHAYLRAALRWGAEQRGAPVDRGLLDDAVATPAHRSRPRRPATVAEAERLIAALEPPFGAEVAMMFYGGLRDAEVAALTWGDIGAEGLSVGRRTDPRTGRDAPARAPPAPMPIPARLRELLGQHRRWAAEQGHPAGPDDWVFGRVWRGAFLPPAHSTICARIRAACRAEGLADDLSADSFRRDKRL